MEDDVRERSDIHTFRSTCRCLSFCVSHLEFSSFVPFPVVSLSSLWRVIRISSPFYVQMQTARSDKKRKRREVPGDSQGRKSVTDEVCWCKQRRLYANNPRKIFSTSLVEDLLTIAPHNCSDAANKNYLEGWVKIRTLSHRRSISGFDDTVHHFIQDVSYDCRGLVIFRCVH